MNLEDSEKQILNRYGEERKMKNAKKTNALTVPLAGSPRGLAEGGLRGVKKRDGLVDVQNPISGQPRTPFRGLAPIQVDYLFHLN